LDQPKQLLVVGGQPIINYLVQKLTILDTVDEILVVTNQKFYKNFIDWSETLQNPKITIINDGTTSNQDRLGSVGDIQYVIDQC
jgi:glucose-1-phosphate thymidylyltransferase